MNIHHQEDLTELRKEADTSTPMHLNWSIFIVFYRDFFAMLITMETKKVLNPTVDLQQALSLHQYTTAK